MLRLTVLPAEFTHGILDSLMGCIDGMVLINGRVVQAGSRRRLKPKQRVEVGRIERNETEGPF